jgi:hypothetical protein
VIGNRVRIGQEGIPIRRGRRVTDAGDRLRGVRQARRAHRRADQLSGRHVLEDADARMDHRARRTRRAGRVFHFFAMAIVPLHAEPRAEVHAIGHARVVLSERVDDILIERRAREKVVAIGPHAVLHLQSERRTPRVPDRDRAGELVAVARRRIQRAREARRRTGIEIGEGIVVERPEQAR